MSGFTAMMDYIPEYGPSISYYCTERPGTLPAAACKMLQSPAKAVIVNGEFLFGCCKKRQRNKGYHFPETCTRVYIKTGSRRILLPLNNV